MKRTLLALTAAVAMIVGAAGQAQALLITPASAVLSGNDTGQAAIDAIVLPYIAPATELYKQDVGGAESGAYAGSYNTVFDPPSDPTGATITYVAGQPVIQPTAWMLVKDGNATPAWYLFNLTALGWNGMETLTLSGFWADTKGAISHVTLYGTRDGGVDGGTDGGGGDGGQDGGGAPEPTTLALFGAALALVGARLRRKS